MKSETYKSEKKMETIHDLKTMTNALNKKLFLDNKNGWIYRLT